MIEIDAKGLFCPEPLMMVQAAMKKNPNENLVVEVDSAAPRDNIVRLATRKHRQVSVEENSEGVIRISIS